MSVDERIEQCLESIRNFVNWYRNRSLGGNDVPVVEQSAEEPPMKTGRAHPGFSEPQKTFPVTLDPGRLLLGIVAKNVAQKFGLTLSRESCIPVPSLDLKSELEYLETQKLTNEVYPLDLVPLFDKSIPAMKLEPISAKAVVDGYLDPVRLFNEAKNVITPFEMCPHIIVALEDKLTYGNGLQEYINEIKDSMRWFQFEPLLHNPPKNQPGLKPTPGDIINVRRKHTIPYVKYCPDRIIPDIEEEMDVPVCFATFVDRDKAFRPKRIGNRGVYNNDFTCQVLTDGEPKKRDDFYWQGIDNPHGILTAEYRDINGRQAFWKGYLPGTQNSGISSRLGTCNVPFLKIKERRRYDVQGYVVNRVGENG